ncbi:TonB-dependent receptor [Diaphorobacter aerolatus]|uniref:TonB-dependent siderophore receptor n=1 Tax=Diaphorobacter aerolatus TaxID=1288495 RepID=A0A7H0GI00_9BURK|nr:TonB-dependent siderophore receptor [Diaphorobacter aerolatus]QNP47916.1 TonB-dependent siderophore receptor [Diaphorobacter aerolatus]
MPSRSAFKPRLNLIVLALVAASAGSASQAQTATQDAAGEAQAQQPETLPQVNVRDKYEREDLPTLAPGRKAANGARLGILGATSIVDAPVHVNAYTRELAEDWSALSLQDVLENDAAVVFTTNKGHLLQNFNLRGLDVGAMDIATNGLYGIAPANSVPIEMFERVEVMRGPNVLLSGMPPLASVAGSVNMVTKRALSQPVADLTTTYVSDSYFQVHADVGKRFGPEQRLGVRFNGVYGSGDMGAEDETQKRKMGALALDYLGDRFRVSLDAYNSVNKIDGGSPGMFSFLGSAAIPGVGMVLAPPRGDVNMFRGTHGQYDNSGLLARAEVDFNPNWQGYFAVGASEAEGKGLLFGTRAIVTGANGATRGAVYNVLTKSERRTAEAGAIGKFATGSVQHRMQLSLNVLKHKEGTYNTPCNYCYNTNMYDPATPSFPAAPAWKGYTTENEFRSVALADTLSFADEKVLLTLGMRHQTVKTPMVGGVASDYSKSHLSPMAAVIVRPWGENVSLFANYTEGLEQGRIVGTGFANAGESLAAMKTQQGELGVKVRMGETTHTLSTFQIEKPSIITNRSNNVQAIDGKQRLRGLEWSAFGKLAPTVSLLSGVEYIKSRQLNTGLENYGVPKLRARIGLDWETPVKGLTAGGRLLYTDGQWTDSGNKLRVPSWTRLDLTAKYETRFGNTPVRLNASVENVANRKYWIGTFADGFVMPGAPRTYRASATVSF